MFALCLLAQGLVSCAGPDPGQGEDGPNSALLSVPQPVSVLGDQDAFGAVTSLALLGPGDVAVADHMNGRITLYIDGVSRSTFGRPGQGPGEFTRLGTLAYLGGDTLIALDQGRRNLTIFREIGDSLVWHDTVDLPFAATAFCTLNGHIFALGRHEGAWIHQATSDGTVLHSFGEVSGEDALDVAFNSDAVIGCSEEAGAIAVVTRIPGDVKVFSEQGSMLFEDSIPSFAHPAFERSGNSMRPLPPPLGYVNMVRAVQWIGKDLLIQLRTSPGDDDGLLESRWLRNGRKWEPGLPRWPLLLAYTPDGMAYVAVEDPYPVVRVYPIR